VLRTDTTSWDAARLGAPAAHYDHPGRVARSRLRGQTAKRHGTRQYKEKFIGTLTVNVKSGDSSVSPIDVDTRIEVFGASP